MVAELITSEDLKLFKSELLDDIKKLLNNGTNTVQKKWLKSPEVRKLFNISPGTLQNFRINGTLPYTKMGGVLYYDYDDIQKILNGNKVHNR
jgi:hypothetical protein